MGDFNEVIATSEIYGGDCSWDSGKQDFKDCLESIYVEDLRAVGHFYTWWNSQELNPIYRKLDRVLVNGSWLQNFPNSMVSFGSRGLSDHCPAIISSGIPSPSLPKPFQFFNFMIDLDNFRESVASAWALPCGGSPLQILSGKLKSVKKNLAALNRNVGNLRANSQNARDLLLEVQNNLIANPRCPHLLSLQRQRSHNLWKALLLEEKLLKQKSRVLWLKEGDKNSSFFHNYIQSRWNRNKILSIENEHGTLVHGHQEVQRVAVDYFTHLLGKPHLSNYRGLSSLNLDFHNTISSQQAAFLEIDISDDEILKTLRSMKKNKAPGPDGFNVNFFLSTWDIVGKDFIAAVNSFFSKGCPL